MTLSELLTTLETRGAFPASRVKDMKTSLRYLAAALGHASPDACPVETASRELPVWGPALDAHFATLETQGRTISAVTRRNTRNNLRVLWRQAETHGLLAVPATTPLLPRAADRRAFVAQLRATTPYKSTYWDKRKAPYRLRQAQWPPALQAEWQRYRAVMGPRLRETTVQGYIGLLETYLGYLANICGRQPVWDDVFDLDQLRAFIAWQGTRLGRPLTRYARELVVVTTAMARVLQHPQAPALTAYRRILKPPAPVHLKRHHMVSLAELEAVAETCLAEGRRPFLTRGKRHPGSFRAVRFQLGVILKLLVRIPLRQRNIRELQLDRHLWKDTATGHWHLDLMGDDLKVSRRGTQVNTYQLNLSTYRPEFIPVLEEWLTIYRPRLSGAATATGVFLTRFGAPFSQTSLGHELTAVVAMHTGKRFYPHLIRTIWATEFLNETRDFQTAATMLGDKLQTVIANYYEVVHKDQVPKASAFLDKQLRAGA